MIVNLLIYMLNLYVKILLFVVNKQVFHIRQVASTVRLGDIMYKYDN